MVNSAASLKPEFLWLEVGQQLMIKNKITLGDSIFDVWTMKVEFLWLHFGKC